ncbi:MAG: hypothetical protein WHT63_00910 [Tepidiforma sp.]
MITVRADENRLLAEAASAADRVVLRHFPGARWLPPRRSFSLPRQMATYRLLDHLFGPEGWQPPAALAEARALQQDPPTAEARLEVLDYEFSVQCSFADRELVKRVPGYRWVPQEKRWRLPRVPETLRILEDGFGELLVLPDGGEVERWREDEEARIAEERRQAMVQDAAEEAKKAEEKPREAPTTGTAEAAAAGEAGAAAGTAARAAAEGGIPAGFEGLYERLDRLTAALERLVEALEAGEARAPRVTVQPSAPGTEPGTGPTDEPELPDAAGAGFDWESELDRLRSEHDDPARQALEARLQQARDGEQAALRMLLGYWFFYNGRWTEALTWFRRALAGDAGADADLEAEAERGLKAAAWQEFAAALGLRGDRFADAYAALWQEVNNRGSGIGEDRWEAGREAIAGLAEDPEIARREASLHGLVRLAQFLGAARRGQQVDEQRLSDFVRDGSVAADTRVLGLVLLASVLYEGEAVADWANAWPKKTTVAGDFSWAAQLAVELLKAAGERHPEVVPVGAVSTLAIVARGPRDWASREQRRQLLRLIGSEERLRGYAEFLAAYRLAAEGDGKGLTKDFKGYFEYLKQVRLDDSWEHLSEVLAEDNGHVTDAIIDDVLPATLGAWGIGNVQNLLDAAEFAKETQRGDNTLNRIADGVEDGTIAGAEALDGEQRLKLFRLALDAARRKTHDQDSEQAFVRLVRELLRQGKDDEVPNLCEEFSSQEVFASLRERALLAGLEWALERGLPVEGLVQRAIEGFRKESSRVDDFRLIASSFPEVREAGGEELKKLLGEPVGAQADPERLKGKCVLIVGGHPSLQTKTQPELEAWGLKVDWLDPESAKQGGRAVDRASGSVDLVVVNTGYIGHAASGRVTKAADSAGNRVVARAFAGPKMLIETVRLCLLSEAVGAATPPAPPRPPRPAPGVRGGRR